MRIQADHVVATPIQYYMKMVNMIIPIARVRSQIIDILFNNMLKFMEGIRHSRVDHSSIIFKAKQHFSVRKHAPRIYEESSMMVIGTDLDLVIVGKYMEGVGYLSLGKYLFLSLKFMYTWMVPWFLSIVTRLETELVKVIKQMKITLSSFLTSTLMSNTF